MTSYFATVFVVARGSNLAGLTEGSGDRESVASVHQAVKLATRPIDPSSEGATLRNEIAICRLQDRRASQKRDGAFRRRLRAMHAKAIGHPAIQSASTSGQDLSLPRALPEMSRGGSNERR